MRHKNKRWDMAIKSNRKMSVEWRREEDEDDTNTLPALFGVPALP